MPYYMLHKPGGCITARQDARHPTVMACFPPALRDGIFPVGRLDKDTEGFLLLTDDGELCYRLMDPAHRVEKTYFFWAMGTLTEDKRQQLEAGVPIFADGRLTAPARVTVTESATLLDICALTGESAARLRESRRGTMPVCSGCITVTEGKKHQVKRMLGAVGLRVVYLRRLSIGGVTLDPTLPRGAYRPLTEDELVTLRHAAGMV